MPGRPHFGSGRTYLVFFDWDKATLTDRARQIIGVAAATSQRVQFTRIEVNGYTDTSVRISGQSRNIRRLLARPGAASRGGAARRGAAQTGQVPGLICQ
jgi:hypothetical protein